MPRNNHHRLTPEDLRQRRAAPVIEDLADALSEHGESPPEGMRVVADFIARSGGTWEMRLRYLREITPKPKEVLPDPNVAEPSRRP